MIYVRQNGSLRNEPLFYVRKLQSYTSKNKGLGISPCAACGEYLLNQGHMPCLRFAGRWCVCSGEVGGLVVVSEV